MKIFVRTLKGARFEIQVNPEDSVADVKKNIETMLEVSAAEQVLIHKGTVLKDETTVEANNVSEKSIIGVMKRKPPSIGTSTSTETPGLSIDVTPTEPASAGERVSESSIQNILGMEYLYFGTEDQSQEPEEADEERLPDSLNDTPEHGYLRAKVQSDPRIVKDFVERLEEQDPAMSQLIQDKKAVFLLLLKVEGGACGDEMEQPHDELQVDQTNEPNNGGDGGNQVGGSEETEVEQPPQELQAEQTNEPNNGRESGDGGNQVVGESEDKGCTSKNPCRSKD